MSSPPPAMPCPKVNVRGPFPPLEASDAQISVSPAGKPVPVQLQPLAGQTRAGTLSGPAKDPVTARPFTDLAARPAVSKLPSAPNCDQVPESLAPCAPWLVISTRWSVP